MLAWRPENDGYRCVPPILLLLVSTDEEGAASRMMQSAPAFNARHRRSGHCGGNLSAVEFMQMEDSEIKKKQVRASLEAILDKM